MDGPGDQPQPRAGPRGPITRRPRGQLRAAEEPASLALSGAKRNGSWRFHWLSGNQARTTEHRPFQSRCGVAHPLPDRARCRGTGAPDKAWTIPTPASSFFSGRRGRPARGWRGGLCGGYRALPSPTAEHSPFLFGRTVGVAANGPQTVGTSATQIERAMFANVRQECALKSVSWGPYDCSSTKRQYAQPSRCRGATPAREGDGVTLGPNRSCEGRARQEHI